MENWGLITYSEFYLCASPETTAVTGQITVAAVIAHELAHQVSALTYFHVNYLNATSILIFLQV